MTRDELRHAAKVALKDRDHGSGLSWFLLVVRMRERLGLSAQKIEAGIELLAGDQE